MPRKRKKKNTQNQNLQQSRPAVSAIPAEPNHSAKSTPESSPTNPTPSKPQPQRQEPKKTTPTLFTESERDELFTMTEKDATTVARARMGEVFPDEEDSDIKQQLAAAEAQHRQFQRNSTERQARRLRDAARPRRGRPMTR